MFPTRFFQPPYPDAEPSALSCAIVNFFEPEGPVTVSTIGPAAVVVVALAVVVVAFAVVVVVALEVVVVALAVVVVDAAVVVVASVIVVAAPALVVWLVAVAVVAGPEFKVVAASEDDVVSSAATAVEEVEFAGVPPQPAASPTVATTRAKTTKPNRRKRLTVTAELLCRPAFTCVNLTSDPSRMY